MHTLYVNPAAPPEAVTKAKYWRYAYCQYPNGDVRLCWQVSDDRDTWRDFFLPAQPIDFPPPAEWQPGGALVESGDFLFDGHALTPAPAAPKD